MDDAETPTEIQSLWIAGLEFVGSGTPAGTPAITKPTASELNLGVNYGSGISETIEIKGRDLTGDLTVTVGSGLTVTYGQQSGSSVTIPQANAIVGAQVTISYSGSGALELEGGLVVSGGGATTKSIDIIIDAVTTLEAVKLTGTQWVQTDFVPTVNTDVAIKLKFANNSNTFSSNEFNFMSCYQYPTSQQQYAVIVTMYDGSQTRAAIQPIIGSATNLFLDLTNTQLTTDKSLMSLDHTGLLSFMIGENGTVLTKQAAAITAQEDPLTLGCYHYRANNEDHLFNKFDVTIYELTITDNGTVVRHYVPREVSGVPGLLDTITGHFMSSKTATELVAIPLT